MTLDRAKVLRLPLTRNMVRGWCGPVLVKTRLLGWQEAAYLEMESGTGLLTYQDASVEDVDLDYAEICFDLTRAECRDRVVRLVAMCVEPGASGPFVWGRWPLRSIGGARGSGMWAIRTSSFLERVFVGWEASDWRREVQIVAGLAELDPSDQTTLSDGSFLVDALALAIIARHVLHLGDMHD